MKSIILIAFFALAANGFNFTAFGIGEAQQYGLTADQIQASLPCFGALDTDFANIVALIQTRDINRIVSEFSGLYNQLQTDIQTTCNSYLVAVSTYFYETAPNATNWQQNMKENFGLYFAEVIQQVAIEINDILSGDYEAAGAAKGYYSQILLGIVTPTTPPLPAFNPTQYVPFDQEEFASEYFQAFFSTIGSNELVNGTAVNSCLTQIISFSMNLNFLVGNFSTYSFTDKVQGISGLFNDAADLVQGCEYGAQLYSTIFEPLAEAFHANPLGFVLKALNNFALNAPQMVSSVRYEEAYILEGNYAAAGQAKGERFNKIFGFAL